MPIERENLVSLFEDLRKRLIIIVAVIFVLAIASFAFSDQIRHFLLLPADMAYEGIAEQGIDLQLIFLTPSEALLANLRLAFITAAAVALPVILYQLVALLMTITGRRAKSRAFILTIIMYLLFTAGFAFAYYVVLPFALNFFIGFSSADLVPNFSFARYISFVTTFIFSFGLVFQMPVVFWFLGSLGVIDPTFLRRNRKYALLIIIICAAVITPPDIFSQVLMAVPLMLLYELGIFMVYLARRKSKTAVNCEDQG